MVRKFVWQPKTQYIEDELRDEQFKLDLQRRLERGEPIWHYYSGRQPTIGPYREFMGDWQTQQREIPWMTPEQEEEWRRSAEEATKQQREVLPWIGLGMVAPFGPTGAAAFGVASRIPWWTLRWPTKAVLGAVYPEVPLSRVFQLGKAQVGQLIGKAKEAVATNLQKLEAHRIAYELGLSEGERRVLAAKVTGKNSMTRMTQVEAEKFVLELSSRYGSRHPVLPFTGSNEVTKQKARETSRELVEYLGKYKPPKQVLTKAARKEPFLESAEQKIYGFTNRTYRLERILDKIDGYPKYPQIGKMASTFWKPVDGATDAKLSKTYSVIDEFRNFYKGRGIQFENFLSRRSVIGGVEFTAGERMGVYLHSKNPQNLYHMKRGNGFDDQLVKDVIDSLTDNEKATADWILKQWADNTPRVAEAFKITTGKNMKTVENYVPIVIRGQDIPYEDFLTKEIMYRYARKFPSTMIKKGFTKARTPKASQPIELDAFQVWLNRLPEVEHYVAFAPVLRDLQRIYNDIGFKNALMRKESKATYEVLGQWLKDIAATNPMKARSISEQIWQQARVNATTAVLGLNITTCFKQFPSFMIGAGEIGTINALKGLITSFTDRAGTTALIKRLSPQIWKRSFEREIAEAKMMKGAGERMLERLSSRELFMILTTTMDRLVVNGLWRGGFDDALRKGMPEKVAAEYATRAIRRTQPFFGVKDVPEFWRSSEGMKALVMFTNQLNQYWNYYRHDVYGAWQYRNLSTPAAFKKIIEGFVMPALMIGSITRSDVPRDGKEFIGDLGSMAFATVPLMGHYLVAGFRGWHESQGLITTEILDKLNQMAYRLNPERWDKVLEDIPKLAELAVQIGGFAKGIPVTQPTRTIKAMLEIAQGNTDDLLELIWGSYVRQEAQKRTGGGSLEPIIKLD